MPQRVSLPVLAIVLAVPACSLVVSDPSEPAEANEAIRGGEAESGMPAVGLVAFGNTYCTGTLIAPDVVLTAAHCISDQPMTFSTTNGSPVATVPHVVAARLAYPSWLELQCPNPTRDIGLLKLAAPIIGITPLAYGAVPPRGDTCTAVGFGKYNGTERKKRSGTSHLDDVVGNAVIVSWGDALADAGDSGGPLLCNDSIVAIAACHTDGDGASHVREYYQRIDEPAKWIDRTIAGWNASP